MNTRALPSYVGSTSKADEYFVGASRINYTKFYGLPHYEAVLGCLSKEVGSEDFTFFLDPQNLLIAGFRHNLAVWANVFGRGREAVAQQEALFAARNQARENIARVWRKRVPSKETSNDLIKSTSLDLSWVFEAMSGDVAHSSSQQIVAAIAGLNTLLKNKQFKELSMILLIINPKRLSPELMLTFARVTFPVRELISSWHQFLRRVKHELDGRNLDSKRLLTGLL